MAPHLVVPAVGLARRLPSGLGLALNADDANGLPLYPESVSYLARLVPEVTTTGTGRATDTGRATGTGPSVPWPTGRRPSPERPPAPGQTSAGQTSAGQKTSAGQTETPSAGRVSGDSGPPARPANWATRAGSATEANAAGVSVGHPPVEPRALLDETRAVLRGLRFVRYASRAWLSVPGAGEGLVISVALDDPTSEGRRVAVVHALEEACAAIPLRVPFPVDVTFPGEILPGKTSPSPDIIDEWISRNTRPFYTRD